MFCILDPLIQLCSDCQALFTFPSLLTWIVPQIPSRMHIDEGSFRYISRSSLAPSQLPLSFTVKHAGLVGVPCLLTSRPDHEPVSPLGQCWHPACLVPGTLEPVLSFGSNPSPVTSSTPTYSPGPTSGAFPNSCRVNQSSDESWPSPWAFLVLCPCSLLQWL